MNQKQIEREWSRLLKREERFLNRNLAVKNLGWQQKIDRFVPEKLSETMRTVFLKAFGVIFEKGTIVIEKTYNRQKMEQDYKINEFAADIRNNHKAMKTFSKQADISRNGNMAISAIEGIGLGILGIGLPDIPLFLAVLLKSIYEVSLTYGFSYDSQEEQTFILKLIETALLHEEALLNADMEVNAWIRGEAAFEPSQREQMKRTSDALSNELLYLKFVQGVPLVGIVGGLSDVIYQKKITDYAALKYRRRFLELQKQKEVCRD